MSAIVLSLLLAIPPVAEGKATRYDPGLMDQVVENRLTWRQLDLDQAHRDYVALADCAYLNRRALLVLADGRLSGPHLVADCGAAGDQSHLDDIGFAVDLSWELARELGAVQAPLRGVRVYLIPRTLEVHRDGVRTLAHQFDDIDPRRSIRPGPCRHPAGETRRVARRVPIREAASSRLVMY